MALQYRVGPLTLLEHEKAQAYAEKRGIDYWQAARMVAIPVRGLWPRELVCEGLNGGGRIVFG